MKINFKKTRPSRNKAYRFVRPVVVALAVVLIVVYLKRDNDSTTSRRMLSWGVGGYKRILELQTLNSGNPLGPESVWEALLEEGKALQQKQKPVGIAMEVGMHRAKQCLQAAKAGLDAHCVEPSPTSFERINKEVAKVKDLHMASRMHLYNVAAGDTSGTTVSFLASGGTGDHVGGHNMWKMTDANESDVSEDKGEMVKVPQKRLDDIVADKKVLVLKVDTQGFEPAVFSGLTNSMKNHQLEYVLFEFWPRGMDLLAGTANECVAAHVLDQFADLGYTLYVMPAMAHPKAPRGYRNAKDWPLDDHMKFCRWFFELETRFPSDEYKMGYWADILAVAPGVHIANPVSNVGKILSQSSQSLRQTATS